AESGGQWAPARGLDRQDPPEFAHRVVDADFDDADGKVQRLRRVRDRTALEVRLCQDLAVLGAKRLDRGGDNAPLQRRSRHRKLSFERRWLSPCWCSPLTPTSAT